MITGAKPAAHDTAGLGEKLPGDNAPINDERTQLNTSIAELTAQLQRVREFRRTLAPMLGGAIALVAIIATAMGLGSPRNFAMSSIARWILDLSRSPVLAVTLGGILIAVLVLFAVFTNTETSLSAEIDLPTSRLRSAFGGCLIRDSGGWGEGSAGPFRRWVLGSSPTTAVPGVGEFTSIRVRRCAPRSGSLARVGTGIMPQPRCQRGSVCRIRPAVTSASRKNPGGDPGGRGMVHSGKGKPAI
jgi:hypothetical protein